MGIRDRLQSPIKRTPKPEIEKVPNVKSVMDNLKEIGITANQLSDKDIRLDKLRRTFEAIERIDKQFMGYDGILDYNSEGPVKALTYDEYNKLVEEGKPLTKMSYADYLLRRCNLIVTLAHTVAVPSGRGGDTENWLYTQKVIAFNINVAVFRTWVSLGVYSDNFINGLYTSALSIITYSWKREDISVNQVLVYINPNSNNQFKGFD